MKHKLASWCLGIAARIVRCRAGAVRQPLLCGIPLLLASTLALFSATNFDRASELDTDGDRITLEQYEQLFGLDLGDPVVAFLDYDQDGVLNWEEAYKRTDPFRVDSDEDGWSDAVDPDISRARLDFHPLFTDGDFLRYVWPSWMVSAFKAGGEWESSLPAWYVPAGTGGQLCLRVDRSVLTQDLRMELEFYDAPNASLFVDVVNSRGEVMVSSESVENLVDGSGEIVRKSLIIPLESYPEAVGIHLRGTGELFVFEGLLFVDQDNDGLDADQEAVLGTSDLMADSDGDGIADYEEVFVYGTNPAKRGASPATGGDKDAQDPASGGTSPASRGINSQALRASRIKAITIPQFVLTWMSGANFIMSRDALDGGGTRQTSTNFILEDSFGQSSAIGFSYGGSITLHAGYQQSEEEELLELKATVRLEPEALNVNPGILTAFVSLPEGYSVRGITTATCDGALYKRMTLSNDETEMIIKFRRQDIEDALAQIGESIDTYFVVRGVWQDEAGISYIFQGADSITKIVGAR